MTKYQKILLEVFQIFTKKQKENLKYHLKRKTPILCGKLAEEYVDGKGGA